MIIQKIKTFGRKLKSLYFLDTIYMYRILFSFLVLCQSVPYVAFAQSNIKKDVFAKRLSANEKIKIDGEATESAWVDAPIAKDFVMREPTPGSTPTYPSEVRVLYDDVAIYVSAKLYDAHPEQIAQEFTQRDVLGNTDWFAVVIDAYRDGQNGVGFITTPRGIQVDLKYFPSKETGGEDYTWNAVWQCASKVTADGWVTEYAIPYSAIRFPNIKEQNWGINFIRRYTKNREQSSWSEINPTVSGFLNQCGTLKGIQNIHPPLRLSATPFISAYAQDNFDKNGTPKHSTQSSYNAGMDIKYGINDAFTVDMTLIPDFGQVQSDSKVLNLSPFEVRFDENRFFFTEGVELFQKGGLLYSRRIGNTPLHYYDFNKNKDEKINRNPETAQLYNATKLSGRTSKGLGVGLLNSIAAKSFATVENANGEQRKIETGPLTNYNMVVLDQNLKYNSSITFLNTNVTRFGKEYDANVTGIEYNLKDKKNDYGLSGGFAASQRFFKDSLDLGHRFRMNIDKLSGSRNWGLGYNAESVQYNPNDLGYLRAPNERSFRAYYNYNQYKPIGKFNRFSFNNILDVGYLYKPFSYGTAAWSGNFFFLTKKIFAFGGNYTIAPIKGRDYFEPRTANYSAYYALPESYSVGGFISTDFRKVLATDLSINYNKWNEAGRQSITIGFRPRARLNDHLFFLGNFSFTDQQNDVGFVRPQSKSIGFNALNNKILFGIRDQKTISNVLTARYAFNNKMTLNIRLRHYWANVKYNSFKTLGEKGNLEQTAYSGTSSDNQSLHNTNYNVFNIDMVYLWRFAPGSDISIVWKNEIGKSNRIVDLNYFQNINTLAGEPQSNSFSIKVLYYLDYINFAKHKS